MYGIGKSIAPAKPFGFHIMQNMSFSPFYQAEEDYSQNQGLQRLPEARHLQQCRGTAHGRLSRPPQRHHFS
jgi:hypothetical protein